MSQRSTPFQLCDTILPFPRSLRRLSAPRRQDAKTAKKDIFGWFSWRSRRLGGLGAKIWVAGTAPRCELAVVALLVAGCASTAKPPAPPSYATVASDPRRDSETAERENAAALDLMGNGDFDGAEAALKRALSADVMSGKAHNNLGLLYFRRSQLYLAAWEFDYAIKLMPNRPEFRNNLGLVFETSGKLDQAVESFNGAVKLEPDNPQYVGNLARARVRRGDRGEDLRNLLQKIVAVDTRRDWLDWAAERLAVLDRRSVGTSERPHSSDEPATTGQANP